MTRRFAAAVALFAAIAAAPALAQPVTIAAPPPAAPPAPVNDLVRVALDTAKGRIVLALDRGRAPVTTANFLRYVEGKRFDGQSFYRAMPYGPDGGLVQGGITDDARKLFPPIAHEPTSRTGLRHVAGAISMGRMAPGTARSDFFILLGDIPGLDASAEPGMDPDGFAVFGHVVEGMEVVRAIFAMPVDPARGEADMKGQMLAQPVRIDRATRLKD